MPGGVLVDAVGLFIDFVDLITGLLDNASVFFDPGGVLGASMVLVDVLTPPGVSQAPPWTC